METVNIAILGLDDDPDDLIFLENVIKKESITNFKLFLKAERFIEGLSDDIHVCIVDHNLGIEGITGLDILRKIKAKNVESFVIAYTGNKQPNLIIDYINSQVNRFVDKNADHALQHLKEFILDGIAQATKRIDEEIKLNSFSNFINAERERVHDQLPD